MDNKTRLQTNNINLNEILSVINNLPEAIPSLDTSDATATASDIVSGKTAYVNGEKVTGTLTIQTYYLSNVEPSSSLGIDGDLYLVRAGE